MIGLKFSEKQKIKQQINLGQRYLLDNEYEQAIACFEQIIKIEPKNTEAYIGLANAYYQNGELKQAIKVLKKGYKQTDNEEIKELLDEYETEMNREEADIAIVQVDTNQFPLVDVYFSVNDNNGELIENVSDDQIALYEKQPDEEWLEKTGRIFMSGTENNNMLQSVGFVLDVSGSMEEEMSQMISAAKSLISQMQDGKCQVKLTTFASHVKEYSDYTKDLTSVSDMLDDLYASGGTVMYDGLITALNAAVRVSGQSCIIAFTDGDDTGSYSIKDDVISLSTSTNIPVYIISLSYDSYHRRDLEEITAKSGGKYFEIDDIEDLYSIYQEIFDIQENLYVYRYETGLKDSVCDIKLEFKSREYAGDAQSEFLGMKPVARDMINNRIINYYEATSAKKNFEYDYLFDDREKTAWSEGVYGNGIGEKIIMRFEEAHSVNCIVIYNGNRANSDVYEKYGRVKSMKVTFSDGTEVVHEMKDNFYEPDKIYFINPVQSDSITLEIIDAYDGKCYLDTCISEIKIN